jgi:hypothetical protein
MNILYLHGLKANYDPKEPPFLKPTVRIVRASIINRNPRGSELI